MKKYLFLFFFMASYPFKAQHVSPPRDSLQQQPYSELDEKIEAFGTDARSAPYLRAYLKKAVSEKNAKEIINGYKNYLHAVAEEYRLVYADSMVIAAKASKNDDLIGSAYLTKGIVHFSQKQHIKALDFYLISNRYLVRGNNLYLKNKVKYNIANIKYYLGHYDEAIVLYKESLDYFKDEDPDAYLSCLHSLGLCYNRIGNYKMCSLTNAFALEEASRLGITDMNPYIELSQGINLYFLNQYPLSIKKIKGAVVSIVREKDFANESVAYFYLGKSYLALGDGDIAMGYFRSMDQLFNNRGYLRPDLREGYELLIKNCRAHNNVKGELYYVNQLLKADSLILSDYKDLSKKIHRDYDTALLLKAKKHLERQLSDRNKYELFFIFTASLLFSGLLYMTYRYFKSRQHYKERFEALINEVQEIEQKALVPVSEESVAISLKPEVITLILGSLEKFETQNKYLQKDLTVGKLADNIGTNPKYLSKVIAVYRGKKFVDYINDLKIGYVITLLKSGGKYWNYTHKALADEAGFSTTQHFKSAFIKKTEITPTFFISELKKLHFSEMDAKYGTEKLS